MSDTYKPTGKYFDMFYWNSAHIIPEHDGLKQDGTPDKRVGTGGSSHVPYDNFQLIDIPRIRSGEGRPPGGWKAGWKHIRIRERCLGGYVVG